MESKYNRALERLKKYKQEHLLSRYEFLNEERKEKILDQILDLNFDQIFKLYDMAQEGQKISNDKITNINYVDKSKLTDEEYDKYYSIGKKIIEEGKYAVVTMAGGQGTRLGYVAPKGTFKIGGEIDKSLFEALSDTIKESQKKYNTIVPWYIMTSRENNNATEKFFEKRAQKEYGVDGEHFDKESKVHPVW